jgi:hypothetical protein
MPAFSRSRRWRLRSDWQAYQSDRPTRIMGHENVGRTIASELLRRSATFWKATEWRSKNTCRAATATCAAPVNFDCASKPAWRPGVPLRHNSHL